MRYQFLDFSDMHPAVKLLFAVMLMFISYLIVSTIGILLSIPLFDLSIDEALKLLSGGILRAETPVLKFNQIMQSIGLFIIPAMLLNYLYRSHKPRAFAYKTPVSLSLIALSIAAIIVSLPIMEYLVKWNANIHLPDTFMALEKWMMNLEQAAEQFTQQLLSGTDYTSLGINVLMIAVIPAIGEEFFFRGIIQQVLAQWTNSKTWGVVLAAAFFSFFHFQFFGFVPRMAFGILFGFIFIWTRSIWYSVLAHFLNNAIAVMMFFLLNKGIINSDPETVSSYLYGNGILVMASLFGTCMVMYLIFRCSKKQIIRM